MVSSPGVLVVSPSRGVARVYRENIATGLFFQLLVRGKGYTGRCGENKSIEIRGVVNLLCGHFFFFFLCLRRLPELLQFNSFGGFAVRRCRVVF